MRSLLRFLLGCAVPCGVIALALLFAGLPTQAQTPANAVPFALAGPAEQADAQATPDTTSPWRYFPLHVGNVWEYEEYGGALLRYEIPIDTVIGGRRFAKRLFRSFLNGALKDSYVEYLRFDTTAQNVMVSFSGSEYLYPPRCSLGLDAGLHDCWGGHTRVAYVPEGALVFGEGAGRGTDTVRTAIKDFNNAVLYRFGANVGLVLFLADGGGHTLSYYRVNGVEHGTSRVVVSREDEAVAGGDVLRIEGMGPLPARSSVRLAYTMARPERLTLALFDVQGRRVRHLALDGSARGAVTVDTEALPAGLYLVRLTAGPHVRTARLAVVR